MIKSILALFGIFLIVSIFAAPFNLEYDFVGALFLMIIAQSALILASPYSKETNLLVIYFAFSLFFFGLIPWLHYSTGTFLWRPAPLPQSIYISLNVCILLVNTFIFSVYAFVFKRGKINTIVEKTAPRNSIFVSRILIVVSILCFTLVLYINGFSFTQLFFRGIAGQEKIAAIETSSLSLFFGMIARLTPAFAFMYAATELRSDKFTLRILFLLLLLSVFPTGVARYLAAFVYIPLALIYFPILRNGYIFTQFLFSSLILVFPFLDQFRYFSGLADISILPRQEFFFQAHFDAYENFGSVIDYDFITNGRQLLGVALFFVPRIFWPDKPVGSGHELAETAGYVFTNISMPFLAEGFVNFGFIGIAIFALLFSIAIAKLDRSFFGHSALTKPRYQTAVYYFTFGAVFFVLRGDLLSGFAYSAAGVVVANGIRVILKLRI